MNAPPPSPRGDTRPLAGVLWMVLTGLLFVGMTATVKYLGDTVPAAQAAFLRYLLGLVFFLPVLPMMLRARFTREDLTLYSLRGAVHTLGVLLWFFAMTRIPLAEVTAMNYLIPVYVTLGAVVFLGERLRLRRLLAVAAAIVGALIVLRPGLREVSPGHVAMLGTALFLAASYLIAKRMTGRDSPALVVAMLSVTVTVGLAPFAWAVWVPVSAEHLGWFLVVAFFATAGHYTMTLAFAAAPIGVTQPVTALQLVWAVALGALLFAEPVDPFVVIGGGVIVAAVIFIALREQAALRAQSRPSEPPVFPREGV
jgi:drug/metabolite transporter (DMT)-like permease